MNLWKQFQRLTAPEPEQLGTVTAHHLDDTSTVELIGGGVLRVRGTSVAVGERAFVRGGLISGAAPDLPVVVQEV